MTIYGELEQEYVRAIEYGVATSDEDKENLIAAILAKHPTTSPEVSTNIRLYFDATGSLEGLAEWHIATLGGSYDG